MYMYILYTDMESSFLPPAPWEALAVNSSVSGPSGYPSNENPYGHSPVPASGYPKGYLSGSGSTSGYPSPYKHPSGVINALNQSSMSINTRNNRYDNDDNDNSIYNNNNSRNYR
jgi:hypothetical protein